MMMTPRARHRRASATSASPTAAGAQVIPVLEDISLAIAAGEFLALMGPVGLGQEHAAQPHRRASTRRTAARSRVGGVDITAPVRDRARRLARRARRLHLPVLQPHPGADGLRERGAAARS
ncbi:MAG: hypothetical protein MZV70_50190 [Desulfobacterales bacterium]|nr:hypothetical protein [Desulfobacterales bacterium]